jgi:hypothetical protein
VVVIVLLLIPLFLTKNVTPLTISESADQTLKTPVIEPVAIDNKSATITPQPVINKSLTPCPTEANNQRKNSYYQNLEQTTTEQKEMLDESFLLSSIKTLGATGGEIVLENDLEITNSDVILPSNITLRAVNPEITIFLTDNRLEIAQKATNVTIKDLTIDASSMTNRYGFVVKQNTSDIKLSNIRFLNYLGTYGCILVMGDNVTLDTLSFSNVGNAYPIMISGSNITVKNCYSEDSSFWNLICVGGGLFNIEIIGNKVLNRPLLSANYGLSTKNILIENNTVFFPAGTYGILIRGGIGDSLKSPHENVIVKGNMLSASPDAGNAIAIYGLTHNAIVSNNTVDMSLSKHNGIGISSGVNVIVRDNVVFGATESSEGGIEVESNPVHNRNVGFSENVTVVGNTVYNCEWGIYVRVMAPNYPTWNMSILKSKDIVIENNLIYNCTIGVNLLYGEDLAVRNNNIISNIIPLKVDPDNVFNYLVYNNSIE